MKAKKLTFLTNIKTPAMFDNARTTRVLKATPLLIRAALLNVASFLVFSQVRFLNIRISRRFNSFYLDKVCRLVINIETVCSDAVKKQDGNTCYKE